MYIGLNNCSNIAFTSKIKFVDREEFDKLPILEMMNNGEYVDFYPFGTGMEMVKEKGATKDIISCNAGGVHGKDETLMFHINPVCSIRELSQKFDKMIKQLRQCNEGLKGFFIGGNRDNPDSISWAYVIKDVFNRNNVKTSVLWGQKGFNLTDIFYSKMDDTWIVCQEEVDPVSRNPAGNLREAFEEVSILPEDQVYFNDKKII